MAATTATQAATAISSRRRLISELYDMLERDQDPNNTVIRELLLGQWEEVGDIQTALGVADEIIQIDPQHDIARAFISKHRSSAYSPAATASSSSEPGSASTSASRTSISSYTAPTGSNAAGDNGSHSASAKTHHLDAVAAMADGALHAGKTRSATRPLSSPGAPNTDKGKHQLEQDLVELFRDLQARAAELEHDIVLLENVGLVDNAAIVQDTRNIREGRLSDVIVPVRPRPVRQLVRELHGGRQECLDLVVQDFAEVAQWTLEQAPADKQCAAKRLPIDAVHERLRRRQELLDAMLPPGQGLEDLGRTAMMRVEHQLLDHGKTYANDKTMLLDDVSAIPPAHLLVTSDNYAWDMAELADALAVNSAVMRNPLTKDMFAEEDVRQILNHPLGQRLRPIAVQQSQLKRGVRADTIDHMDRLSRVMLTDQSADATPTIEAIDIFMAYYHTLPDEEKSTLKSLKVPATDSHTGQAYDSAILEAVQDAKANRVCYHKIGDFLKQAAKNLKENA